MRIRIRTGKNGDWSKSGSGSRSLKIYWFFFNKTKFSNYLSHVFRLFLCKTYWTIHKSGNFNNTFLQKFRFGFLQFLDDILPLGSGSVDSDPGSQNFADPTDPDPKHCLIFLKIFLLINKIFFNFSLGLFGIFYSKN